MPSRVDLPPLCIYTFVALAGRLGLRLATGSRAGACLPEDLQTLVISVV